MARASLTDPSTPAPRRWRSLLALGLAVAAVHLLLLQAMPLPGHSNDLPPPMAFSTRTITLNPPAPPAPPPPPPPPPTAAPPAKPAPARPARPRPAPPSATVAEAPAVAEPAIPEAAPSGVAEAPPPAIPEPAPAASAPVVAEAPAEPAPQAPATVPITIPGSVRLLYDVQGQVKKAMRDDGQVITPDRTAAIVKELGDLLWYAARLADELGVPLSEVMQANLDKLQDRMNRGVLSGSGDNR